MSARDPNQKCLRIRHRFARGRSGSSTNNNNTNNSNINAGVDVERCEDDGGPDDSNGSW